MPWHSVLSYFWIDWCIYVKFYEKKEGRGKKVCSFNLKLKFTHFLQFFSECKQKTMEAIMSRAYTDNDEIFMQFLVCSWLSQNPQVTSRLCRSPSLKYPWERHMKEKSRWRYDICMVTLFSWRWCRSVSMAAVSRIVPTSGYCPLEPWQV